MSDPELREELLRRWAVHELEKHREAGDPG
jgi:hypothetical protein